MKPTPCLYKHHVGRMFENIWKRKSKQLIPVNDLAERIENDLNVKVKDANDVVKKKMPTFESYNFPEPLQKRPITIGPGHLLWKDRICHIIDPGLRLLEGVDQAQILTKTIVKKGLPTTIQELVSSESIPNQDDYIKHYLLQSHCLDAIQTKHPRVMDPKDPGGKFPRVYGIERKRKILNFIWKIINFCDLNNDGSTAIKARTHLRDAAVSLPIEKDNDLLWYKSNVGFMITSERALLPFANSDEVNATASDSLPNIYPIKHTINLKQTNIYQLVDHYPFMPSAAHPYLHTLFGYYDGRPIFQRRNSLAARALLTCYSFAMAQARAINKEHLDHPIAVQCIFTDSQQFLFMCFQLNSLDANGQDGIKNIAWMDNWEDLYYLCEDIQSRPVLEGYNSNVFNKILAMHRNTFHIKKLPSKEKNQERVAMVAH